MTDGDTEVAKLLGATLIERRDVKAIQRDGGAYNPVTDTGKADGKRLRWRVEDLIDHVAGRKTYGHYLVSAEGTCRVLAFDIDLVKEPVQLPGFLTEDLRAVWLAGKSELKSSLVVSLRQVVLGFCQAVIDTLGLSPVAAYSGCKGAHVLVPLDAGTPAEDARVLGQTVFDELGFTLFKGRNFYNHSSFPEFEVEIYPKQDDLNGKDLGNLMRLPLGVHRKSGKPGFFIDMSQPFERLRPDDPMTALRMGSLR